MAETRQRDASRVSQSLDDIRQASEALLAEGAADPGSVWRSPALVTAGADGAPQARTVVLRRFEAGERFLEVHADARSAKIGELATRPDAGLHGWDAARQVQLRLTGRASLHRTGPVADAAWAALRPQSRATYDVLPGPGTVIASPERTSHVGEEARGAFCVIRLAYTTLEYLHLGKDGHRRARFTWSGGALVSDWLVP